MGNVVWSILWLIALLFIGWPVAAFLAPLYVLLLPFSVCIDPCKDLVSLIFSGVQLPRYCADGMVHQKPMCK